jgi:hypothetical protein
MNVWRRSSQRYFSSICPSAVYQADFQPLIARRKSTQYTRSTTISDDADQMTRKDERFGPPLWKLPLAG